jgi:hypothetical protein
MSDPGTTYRTTDEVKKIRELRDPIEYVSSQLISNNFATQAELDVCSCFHSFKSYFSIFIFFIVLVFVVKLFLFLPVLLIHFPFSFRF